jgi:hypothetical protein
MISDSNHVIWFICLFLCTPYAHNKEVKPSKLDARCHGLLTYYDWVGYSKLSSLSTMVLWAVVS